MHGQSRRKKKMIAKCRENGGIGDCPFLKYCFARMNDPTISGCSMPFVWTGMMKISDAVVEHTVSTEKEELPRIGKRKERKIKRNGK